MIHKMNVSMRKSLLLLGMLLLFLCSIFAQGERAQFVSLLGSQLSVKGIERIGLPIKSNVIPFQLNGGLIFFKAKLNGVSDTFVLDTGSPGLLLNDHFKDDNKENFAAVGVNGGLSFQRNSGHSFEMGAALNWDVNSLSTNLNHLEKVKGQKFRGMVGQGLLKTNELFLDYKNKSMQLLKGGKSEDVAGCYRSATIPVTFQQHFAVVKVKIGRRFYHFGLDTGAEVNIIDEDLANHLSSKLFRTTERIKIRGVSKKGVGARVGKIASCQVADKKIEDMSFVVMDMKNLNGGKNINLDGLLGYPFLSSDLFSIDYVEGLLYVWKKGGEIMVRD